MDPKKSLLMQILDPLSPSLKTFSDTTKQGRAYKIKLMVFQKNGFTNLNAFQTNIDDQLLHLPYAT